MNCGEMRRKIRGNDSFCHDSITLGTALVIEIFLFDTMKESTAIDRTAAVCLWRRAWTTSLCLTHAPNSHPKQKERRL